MASRVTLYGNSNAPDIKRLKREMNVLFVEYEQSDPARDPRAARRLADMVGETPRLPLVEVLRDHGDGSVFLTNPDEPTLRQCLYSENILSVTAYWV